MTDLDVGRFDSGDYDVADFVRHLNEQWKDGHGRRWPNLTKRYLENDLYLHACFTLRNSRSENEAPRHYSAVFERAFDSHVISGEDRSTEPLGLHVRDGWGGSEEMPVLVWVIEFVEGVEKPRTAVAPSRVRLECFDRLDSISTRMLEVVSETGAPRVDDDERVRIALVRDRERYALGFRRWNVRQRLALPPKVGGHRVEGEVIERHSEAVNNVPDQKNPMVGRFDPFCDRDVYSVLAGLGVYVTPSSVGLFPQKAALALVEGVQLTECPFQHSPMVHAVALEVEG